MLASGLPLWTLPPPPPSLSATTTSAYLSNLWSLLLHLHLTGPRAAEQGVWQGAQKRIRRVAGRSPGAAGADGKRFDPPRLVPAGQTRDTARDDFPGSRIIGLQCAF